MHEIPVTVSRRLTHASAAVCALQLVSGCARAAERARRVVTLVCAAVTVALTFVNVNTRLAVRAQHVAA